MKRIVALYKASYSGLDQASWWLSAVMLINRSGTMVVPFMTLYLTQKLNYSISQAGIVMGIFGAGAICGGFIGGRVADKIGFYPVQLITLAGGGVLFMVLGQMRDFHSICLFTFLLAVVNDSFRPANAIAIAHYSKEENRTS
jgi:predicted MFS family arabinose efflux permease